jgi:V/A-type H+-transporting ATPase subunit I
MDRVLIVGTKDVMERTINALHDLSLLHMEDYTEEEEYFRIGKPLKSATSLSEKLLKLRSIKSYLGTGAGKKISTQSRDKILKDLETNLTELEIGVTKKMSEKGSYESELKEINHKEEALKPYEALGIPLELLSGYDNISVYTGTVPADIEPIIKGITGNYELFSAPYGKGNIIALFVERSTAPKVSEALFKNDFVEIEPLKDTGEPGAIRIKLSERKSDLELKLDIVKKELNELNAKYAGFILSSEELLTIDTQKAEAPLRFATSDNTFIVDGWVPKTDFEKLKASLAKATDDKVYITTVEPEHKKYEGEMDVGAHTVHHEVNAPVKYNNPKFMYPLQAFIDLYSRPKYDEIDPTQIFFFLFPIFYGFILGDIGYGALLFVIAIVIKSKLKHSEGWQILMNTLMLCSVSSVFFGILFGEFLGFSLAHYYPHHVVLGPIGPFSLPLERLMPGGPEHGAYVFGIKDLLVLTCIIGVCQLLFGYMLGFRNEYRQHGLKTALLHKGSWMCILVGGVAMIWYIFPLMLAQAMGDFNIMDPLFLIGGILFLAGIAMLLMGEGLIGVLEIPTLMSNVLSYTRLLAVGLSSVGIAFAVNAIVAMLAGAGIIGLIGAAIVFFIGHSVNLVLGVIAPGLHALRLHYVEFFTKFYKGGGKIYDPFGYTRKYTEE